MRKLPAAVILSITVFAATPAFSWDGTDRDTGDAVEIEKGQLVRTGNDIEYYNYGGGDYKNGTVNSITRTGSSVEIELEDSDTGETRTLDMDDR